MPTSKKETFCRGCGEPLLVAEGKTHKWTNPKNGEDVRYHSPDEDGHLHRGCRANFRRQKRKMAKKIIKITQKGTAL